MPSGPGSGPPMKAFRRHCPAGGRRCRPMAMSAWRGTIRASPSRRGPLPAGVAVTLTQPVFRGFRTVSGTAQAEALVSAGRQSLLSVEQQVLLDAATAYMNVIRDRNVLAASPEERRGAHGAAQERRRRVSRSARSPGPTWRSRGRVWPSRNRRSRLRKQIWPPRLRISFASSAMRRAPCGFPQLSSLVPKSLDSALALSEQINPTFSRPPSMRKRRDTISI